MRLKGRGRPGFTFIEVMFALVILAFGVIMVAAMLPVAVRQTQTTRETNAGSAIIESGFHQLETLWSTYDAIARGPTFPGGGMPATNRMNLSAPQDFVVTFPAWGWGHAWNDGTSPDTDGDSVIDPVEVTAGTDPNDGTSFPVIGLFAQSGGNRIESSMGRDAWIPFYTRSGTLAPTLALVGVRARNVDAFVQGHFINWDNAPLPVLFEVDALGSGSGSPKGDYEGTLSARAGVHVEHIEPTVIRLDIPSPAPGAMTIDQVREAAVEGAVLVMINASGQIRMLTLGKPRPEYSEDHWELAPGGDIRLKVSSLASHGSYVHEFESDPAAASETPVRGYLVGRMLKDPTAPWDPEANPYVGPTQVVQVLEGKMLR